MLFYIICRLRPLLLCGAIGLLSFVPRPVCAQAEWSRWYFGNLAGLRFTPDSAVVLRDSRMISIAACASISDSAGHLRLYSNGRRVWNGRHQVLANGTGLGGDSVSSQGCALLPSPARLGRYFLFTLDAWRSGQRRGLRVAEVDANAAGGQGSVISRNQAVVPDTLLQRLGNHLFLDVQALVRHPNRRDYWLVTHLVDTNVFLSVRVTGNGFFRSDAVVSAIGRVRNASTQADRPGMLVPSADGRRLALNTQITGVEVFDFDPNTGRVTNSVWIGWGIYSLGVAFSSNGNLLYSSVLGPAYFGTGCTLNSISEVRQFDLGLPTAAAVAASGQVVYSGCGHQVCGLQRAMNGRVYVANLNDATLSTPTLTLDVIEEPNVRGSGCRYSTGSVNLGPGRWVNQQFPVVPNDPPQPRLQALLPLAACTGQAVAFVLNGSTLGAAGDTLDWDFGDGRTLRTASPQATHVYATVGSYQLTVRLRNRRLGPAEQLRVGVSVTPLPVLDLGPDLRLCAGSTVQLSVGSLLAGSRVRWQDGSTANSFVVRAPGLYWAEVRSAAGCMAHDTVRVTGLPAPVPALTATQPLCLTDSVLLKVGTQPAGSRYRWQDGSTAPTFWATMPGTYEVTVATAEGCEAQASLELSYDEGCPVQLPNIITPNGDLLNQIFFLQGLTVADWAIRIYSRWGREVFQQARYDNAWAATGQADGIYYYLLTNAKTGRQYKGWVEVRR